MTRLTDAWRAMAPEQRLAAVAAVGLLVTMFLPWYGLQSLDRRTGVINSHDISAFGDVSFVEAAIFLVAASVIVMLLARAEGREFQLPGGDGTIVMIAGGWAALLIFFRVFSRPSGGGEPVGIEWGFFLAFVAAGALAYAGWRMRSHERPQAPVRRRPRHSDQDDGMLADEEPPPPPRRPRPPATTAPPAEREGAVQAPAGEDEPTRRVARRPRYPPAPAGQTIEGTGEQLSFEDPPTRPR
jgi:hypothetical protein